MSRQKKQAKVISLRKRTTAIKKAGGKVSFTEKLTSNKKGRCIINIDKTGTRSRVSASAKHKD
jgi:hypothetical protein